MLLLLHRQSKRPAIRAPIDATFKVTDAKYYVPVVTLSTEDGHVIDSHAANIQSKQFY